MLCPLTGFYLLSKANENQCLGLKLLVDARWLGNPELYSCQGGMTEKRGLEVGGRGRADPGLLPEGCIGGELLLRTLPIRERVYEILG